MRPMPLSTERGLTPVPLRVLCYSCDISGNTHVESEIALLRKSVVANVAQVDTPLGVAIPSPLNHLT